MKLKNVIDEEIQNYMKKRKNIGDDEVIIPADDFTDNTEENPLNSTDIDNSSPNLPLYGDRLKSIS